MNPRTRHPRSPVLAATIAATAALTLTLTAGCDGKSNDCDKRDKGAPTQTTSGNDTKFASFTKTSGGTGGARGGTTGGGSKGGTTKGGVTAGNSSNDDCD